MEFTLDAINKAHSLYTGPDFPKLIREFKVMGMVTNIFNLETGVVSYINKEGEYLYGKGFAVDFNIEDRADYETALAALQRNQKGDTNFPTFCIEIAKTGIYKWISDLDKMTCSYYDKQEKIIIEEKIPMVK